MSADVKVWHAYPDASWRATLCGLDSLPPGEAAAPGLTKGGCRACRRTYKALVEIETLRRRLDEDDARTVVHAVARAPLPDSEASARNVLAVRRICARASR